MRVIEYITQADPELVAAEYRRAYRADDGWADAQTYRDFRAIVVDAAGVQSDMLIEIVRVREDGEDGEWFDVSGVRGGTSYAIEYNPWSEWKLQEVSCPEDLNIHQVACHLYYEMTWGGWPDDAAARLAEIEDSFEEAKRMLAPNTPANGDTQ